MRGTRQRFLRIFWCCLALVVSPVFTVKADLVNLIAYVSYSLLNNLGLPLADGTIVSGSFSC